QGYVDSSLRRDVYRYWIDDPTVGDSRHVLRRRRVLYSADEDFDRILVSLNTDQVEGVTHDTDRAGLAASGNPWPHHIIDQSLHDVDRGLSETLVLVSTAGVWKENGTSRDVALQPRVLLRCPRQATRRRPRLLGYSCDPCAYISFSFSARLLHTDSALYIPVSDA